MHSTLPPLCSDIINNVHFSISCSHCTSLLAVGESTEHVDTYNLRCTLLSCKHSDKHIKGIFTPRHFVQPSHIIYVYWQITGLAPAAAAAADIVCNLYSSNHDSFLNKWSLVNIFFEAKKKKPKQNTQTKDVMNVKVKVKDRKPCMCKQAPGRLQEQKRRHEVQSVF